MEFLFTSLAVLAVDLKGAFSNILPQSIYNRLIELETSARIANFISFLISGKHLYFNLDDKDYKNLYIGVPQIGQVVHVC